MSENIVIIDNFYNEDNYNDLFLQLRNYPFKYFWGDQHGSHYWNSQLEDNSLVRQRCDQLWSEFNSKFSYTGNLSSMYLNALTYGLEAGPHFDYEHNDGITVINYITDTWNITWGGETMIYDSFVGDSNDTEYWNDVDKLIKQPLIIDAAVLPSYNRILVFPSDQLHMVKPISRFHTGVRYTYMYKLQGITVNQLMDGYMSATNSNIKVLK
jgi:SM-20-related protein